MTDSSWLKAILTRRIINIFCIIIIDITNGDSPSSSPSSKAPSGWSPPDERRRQAPLHWQRAACLRVGADHQRGLAPSPKPASPSWGIYIFQKMMTKNRALAASQSFDWESLACACVIYTVEWSICIVLVGLFCIEVWPKLRTCRIRHHTFVRCPASICWTQLNHHTLHNLSTNILLWQRQRQECTVSASHRTIFWTFFFTKCLISRSTYSAYFACLGSFCIPYPLNIWCNTSGDKIWLTDFSQTRHSRVRAGVQMPTWL